MEPEIRLTSYAHGGGCGCKIAPSVLEEILSDVQTRFDLPDLLVGAETSDDAVVYRLNDAQAIVATTDFFMPIVDDPVDFGRIAATNALSDVYAMGGKPLFALAITGMPVERMPVAVIRGILSGGELACRAAGVVVAGGHSIDSPEPIYGLAVIGLVHPEQVKTNRGARDGDVLILGKGLGVGVLSAALKQEVLDDAGYAELVATTTQLNAAGQALAAMEAVHAMTDVTGFGLLGHLAEMCRAGNLGAEIEFDDVPVLARARRYAMDGYTTGAAGRNWDSYGKQVSLPAGLPDWQKTLLCDPQTSGGLLIAVGSSSAGEVLDLMHAEGHADAAIIGRMVSGAPGIVVNAKDAVAAV